MLHAGGLYLAVGAEGLCDGTHLMLHSASLIVQLNSASDEQPAEDRQARQQGHDWLHMRAVGANSSPTLFNKQQHEAAHTYVACCPSDVGRAHCPSSNKNSNNVKQTTSASNQHRMSRGVVGRSYEH
ncbi:hypothetical protein HaLaN_33069, partial [Haematococcus lacustris]